MEPQEIKLFFTGDTLDTIQCDHILVPLSMREIGVTDDHLANLLRMISDDFKNGNVELHETN